MKGDREEAGCGISVRRQKPYEFSEQENYKGLLTSRKWLTTVIKETLRGSEVAKDQLLPSLG